MSNLAIRALLAAALMVGFYLLAAGLIAILLYIPYAEWHYTGRVHFRLVLVCVGFAVLVIGAILPGTRDPFQPPGPELHAADQPRLFREVQEVATSTGQQMPREIYLLPEVNAFVSRRGGAMGVGGRRVMGIGLPLLQGLTIQQVRSVIAHEFGHYVGGDVALAPWIHGTRAAIGRAVERLEGQWLSRIFKAYGNLFARLTMAISRRQEFLADEIAAKVAGVEAAKTALTRVSVLAGAHLVYYSGEVVPVLQAGFLPPIAEGFRRFRATPHFADATGAALTPERTAPEAGPFDSHPSLRERLATLDRIPVVPMMVDCQPATVLLNDVEQLERDLLAHRLGADHVGALTAIDWEAVPTRVFQPLWGARVASDRSHLSTMTMGDLPEGPAAFRTLGRIVVGKLRILPDDEYIRAAASSLGCALALKLVGQGWTLSGGPGETIRLARGGEAVEPFTVVGALAAGRMTTAAWRETADRLGIATQPLV